MARCSKRLYWNFQSEAKMEQIIAIVTTRCISLAWVHYMLNLFFKDRNLKILFKINVEIFNIFLLIAPYNLLLYLPGNVLLYLALIRTVFCTGTIVKLKWNKVCNKNKQIIFACVCASASAYVLVLLRRLLYSQKSESDLITLTFIRQKMLPLKYQNTIPLIKSIFKEMNWIKDVLLDRIEHAYLFYCSNLVANSCFLIFNSHK